MSKIPKDKIQEFLARIGPRELTDAEAKKLHLLHIRAGKSASISGMIAKLAAEAEPRQEKCRNPALPHHHR